MSDLFTDAIDILADSPVGSAGVLTPPAGAAVPCTLLGLRQVDPPLGLASPDVAAPGFLAELRRSEFPTAPAEGSTVAVDGLTLRLHAVRTKTYTWELDLYAV